MTISTSAVACTTGFGQATSLYLPYGMLSKQLVYFHIVFLSSLINAPSFPVTILIILVILFFKVS
jgi:hypothetical protein